MISLTIDYTFSTEDRLSCLCDNLCDSPTETCTGCCKNMLHGYLPGQASSALGMYQIEALKREFISFTGLILESMNTIKKPDLI